MSQLVALKRMATARVKGKARLRAWSCPDPLLRKRKAVRAVTVVPATVEPGSGEDQEGREERERLRPADCRWRSFEKSTLEKLIRAFTGILFKAWRQCLIASLLEQTGTFGLMSYEQAMEFGR